MKSKSASVAEIIMLKVRRRAKRRARKQLGVQFKFMVSCDKKGGLTSFRGCNTLRTARKWFMKFKMQKTTTQVRLWNHFIDSPLEHYYRGIR